MPSKATRQAKQSKKRKAKRAASMAPDTMMAPPEAFQPTPPLAPRVLYQTFGELPAQWPMLLLRHGLLLLVDGIDARYGLVQPPRAGRTRR